MRWLLCILAVTLGCKGSSTDDPPTPTSTSTPTPASSTVAPKASPFTPDAITADEVRPLLPAIDGARSLRDLKVIATAVDGSICIDKAPSLRLAADDLVEKLLAKGWESRSPRQTAEPNVIAIDARKRPYLLRASVTGGTADGGADECAGKTQIKISYFVSKNDASFGRP